MKAGRSHSGKAFGTGLLAAGGYLAYGLPALAGIDTRYRCLSAPAKALRSIYGIKARMNDSAGYALTFDDGPHSQGTPAVLEILAAAGAQATFFLVGEQVQRNPGLAGEIAAAGHLIGLHCQRHRNLLRLSPRAVREDLRSAQALIEDASGQPLRHYRPPYGVANTTALKFAREQNWSTWLWSDWGRDWESKATAASIVELMTRETTPGGIGLLHDADDYSAADSWRRTVAALPRILEHHRQQGMSLRLLPER